MKKLLLFLLFFVIIFAVGMFVLMQSIRVKVTNEDLPQSVYQNVGDTDALLTQALIDVFETGSAESQYNLTEVYMNILILQAIKENINPNYDPLSDCQTIDCTYIYKDDGGINYLFAQLEDNNQLTIVISLTTDQIIPYETAVYVTFDVSIDMTENRLLLTFDRLAVGPYTIPGVLIDFVLNQLDLSSFESMIDTGTLDLDTMTYEVVLTESLPEID